MKGIFLWFFCLGFPLMVSAQYGNEWIDYSQTYYKFPIVQDGVYRISGQTLQNAGIPIASIDPRTLRIYGKGAELPLFIPGEGDGQLAPNEFIEFVAFGNDGFLDRELYEQSAEQAHPARSLFTDTLYYFLTWSNSNGLRYISEVDTNAFAYSPVSHRTETIRQVPGIAQNTYYTGVVYSGGTLNPIMDAGEGFASLTTGNLNFAPAWNSGPLNGFQAILHNANAELELRTVTASNPTIGQPDHAHELLDAGGNVLESRTLDGYRQEVYSRSLSFAQFSGGSSPFAFRCNTSLSGLTRNGITEWSLKLPLQTRFGARSKVLFSLPPQSGLKRSLLIRDFNPQGGNVRLYDLSRRRRIPVQAWTSGNYRAVVPGNSQEIDLYVSAESAITNIVQLKPAGNNGRFQDFESSRRNADYLILTNAWLRTGAQQYANFRKLTGFSPMVVEVQELSDQFGQGVAKHPEAIRRFLRLAYQEWDLKPRYAFFIGKGIKYTSTRNNQALAQRSLVPPMGEPASDNLYAWNLLGDSKQHIATGRLAAETNQQVLDYLAKMQAHVSEGQGLWRKRFLHLGGGNSAAEQLALAGYLNNFKRHAEDSLMGGQVVSLFKNTSAPIQISQGDSIQNLINNEGVSVITIFGHGSGQGFDQNIDQIENYTNQGRYFMLIANSCFTGDIFTPQRLVSEDFVLTPNKAAVGFLAYGAPGISSLMSVYADTLYRNFCRDRFGLPFGDAMLEAVNGNTQPGSNILVRFTAQGFQLHGDPGYSLRVPKSPDLFITSPGIRFEPTELTTDLDSFQVVVAVQNQGRMPYDSVLVSVRWNRLGMLNGDTSVSVLMPPVGFSDTARLWLPLNPQIVPGLHQFTVTVDPSNLITETTKSNNSISLSRTISSADILPVFPPRYAVVPDLPIRISVQTGDPFAPQRGYRIELDTTPSFNSPFLRDTTFVGLGGVYSWTPGLQAADSTVFFWRAGVDSASTGIYYKWRNSSFQYINNRFGWGQARFSQLTENSALYMAPAPSGTAFDFVPVFKKLNCKSITCPTPSQYRETYYDIDGAVMERDGCTAQPAIHIAIIDPITLEPWESRFGNQNTGNVFGNINDNGSCRARPEKYFIYWLNSPVQQIGLENLLYSVPNDHYILAYTFIQGPFSPTAFPSSLVTAFESLGADTLRTLVDSSWARPYIFFARKGDLASAQEVVGMQQCGTINLSVDLSTDWVYGNLSTSLIGPASEWRSLTWQSNPEETNPLTDLTYLRVFGVRANGGEDLLMDNLTPGTQIINNLNDSVSAQTYPYLRLQYFTRDDQNLTPGQLNQWHVLFDGVPEMAFAPNRGFSFAQDSLQRGDTLEVVVPFQNIGFLAADSFLVQHQITNLSGQSEQLRRFLPASQPGDLLFDTLRFPTLAIGGQNTYFLEGNPAQTNGSFLEQTLSNNNAVRPFFVGRDRTNPLLDVTFDGIRIMDGDLVSANPLIQISLSDENPLLPLNDTADFELYLRRPGSSQPVLIPMGDPAVTFFPATAQDNEARLEFRPDLEQTDGMYELLVRARDRSGNISGTGDGNYDYRVRFEVVHQSTITEVMNYPNPFSTSTRFVFTLTGTEVPDELTIRIITVSGVVVREITMDELGPLHIGRNITQFAWDGTDEFGDPLATGTYIYQVVAKTQGEDLERRASGADRFFKNGFGKMYLLR